MLPIVPSLSALRCTTANACPSAPDGRSPLCQLQSVLRPFDVKGGVVLLTRSLAVEYAHQRLRVNCVCPGGVDTPLTRAFRPPEAARPELLTRMSLVPRLARPEQIASAVAYLASDEARNVNGAALPVDAGQVA